MLKSIWEVFDKKFKFQGGNYPYLYIIQELNTVNRRKEGKIKTVLSRAVFSAKIHSNASVFTARHFVLQMDNSKHTPNGCNSTVVNPLLCEIFAESQHFSCILILVFQMYCSAKLSQKWWKWYPFQKYLYRTVMSHSCLLDKQELLTLWKKEVHIKSTQHNSHNVEWSCLDVLCLKLSVWLCKIFADLAHKKFSFS